MVRHRNLTKGGYSVGSNAGMEIHGSFEHTSTNYSSTSSTHFHQESSSSGSSSSSSKRQDAVQMWPQEVNLKLRISKI